MRPLERGPAPAMELGADHKRTLPEVILGAQVFNAVRRRIPEGSRPSTVYT